MERDRQIVIATNNNGKVREFAQLLAGLPLDPIPLSAFSGVDEVAETGSTFAQNAELKAAGYAAQVGLPVMADDSGLEVAALGGRPGVLSARYGGENTTFAKKIEMLLAELDGTGDNDRSARFVCSISLAGADGNILRTTEGVCPGHIAPAPRGELGFGYDPVFVPEGFNETFGELPSAVKNKLSHRANAAREIIPFLQGFFEILT